MRRKVYLQSGKSSGCRIRCELPGATSKRTNEQEILCTARNLRKDILLAAQGPRRGLSQILCKHCEAVQNRAKMFQGGSGAISCRLVYKITAV